MTLIASILFATAFAASIGVIMLTVGNAMPRIVAVIEAEFAPAVRIERRISFGPVKQRQIAYSAEVVAFPPVMLRTEADFKLAA